MIVWDADDFGVNHVISDMCQSHDCRDKLDEFHYVNPNFKATLFAIPSQMTYELLEWCKANSSWIELAVHGFTHSSNFECEKMSYEDFNILMEKYEDMFEGFFVKGFKAPGWQISDGIYQWLADNDWWVADQSYNNNRRPDMSAYVNNNGNFSVWNRNDSVLKEVNGLHYHTWDCVGNGVYELSDQIKQDIQSEEEFKFISEVLGE
jgi:hypothetical protein